MFKSAQKGLDEDVILVVDDGLKISDLHEAGIDRYDTRLATNFTARRNFLPDYHKERKPEYDALVRPLPRKHKDKTLEATQPDATFAWVEDGSEILAEIWRNVVLNTTIPDQENQTFDVSAFNDPDFD